MRNYIKPDDLDEKSQRRHPTTQKVYKINKLIDKKDTKIILLIKI